MIGILAEKPSALRNMAKAFGGTSGTYNGEQYVIVSAAGHLYEFVKPEMQVVPALSKKYHSWSLDNLPWDENDFLWKRTKKKGVDSLLKNIKNVLSTCDEIVIGTDDDPTGEGSLLAWEIIDELNLSARKWSRMYFDDESPKSLQKAFVNRKTISEMNADMDYVKASYRAMWDYMSMQFTRVATMCGDGRSVLRQGRLKSIMVKLVGDALKALAAYKKIPSYQNKFKDENGVIYTNPDEPTYKKKEDVSNIYHTSDVVLDSKTMKKTAPPKLMDLAALASKLEPKGFKAKYVQDVYQKMYESQVVSYPRTEDKVITPEQFNDLLPLIDSIATVVGVDTSLLTHRTPRKTHVKTGGAHGANRPGPNVPNSLDDLLKYGDCAPMIYEILAKNYLATIAEDYEYESQKGHVKDYPKFVGTSSVPKKMGWKLVFNTDDDEDLSDDTGKGLGTVANPYVYEGFPPKPPIPTMKWMMKQLEKYDVGTGATRTSTYSDVTNAHTKYPLMKSTKGKLTLTEYGEMSYLLLPGTNIGSIDKTEQLMQEMRDIAAGKKSPKVCLHAIQQMVLEDIDTMKKNGQNMRKELGIMVNGVNNDVERFEGTWNEKQVRVKRVWSNHRFTDDECEKLLNGEEITIQAKSNKTGNDFYCKGRLAELKYKDAKYIGFENLGFVNPPGVPKMWCQHVFTDDERELLEQGLSIECDDFVSNKGNKFSAKVHYGKNDKGDMSIIPEF